MNIILKENETMQDLVDRLAYSFELVNDIAPVAYWYEHLHENGRIKSIHFSNRMREMLGYRSEAEFPDDLNAFKSFLHPDDVQAMLDAAIAAGTGKTDGYNITYRIRKADGSYLWARATGEVVTDCGGTTVGMYGGFIDITPEKRLEEQQEQLKAALAAANLEKRRNDVLYDIIHSGRWSLLLGPNDEIISADDAADANHIARNSVPADGLSWLQIVHPDDRERVTEAFLASVRDHSCRTPYDLDYRIVGQDGIYRWMHAAGRAIRGEDGTGEFFGILVDITDQMEAQRRRLLGAVPISPDILAKENIGMWAFELDEGQPPRMYGDEAMLGLVGLDRQVPPEEMYHAWYDHIEPDSCEMVADAVARMISGEHAEVQYPWRHPDGHMMIVRCGGVRNPEYTKGIRVEGTHQNVTEVLHFDDEQRRALAETNARLFALEDNFESLYEVNLESGEYVEFIKGRTFSEKVSTRFGEHREFFEDSLRNIDAVAFPDDREDFKRVISREYIVRELEAESHFDYFYRLQIDDDPVWFRMRAVYKDEEKKDIIIGIFNASKDIEAKQIAEQKEQLETKQNRLMESLAFTNFFLNAYTSAYYVNLDDLSYQVYKRPQEQERYYPVIGNYHDSLKVYIDREVHPEDREELIRLLAPGSVRDILKEVPEYLHYYRAVDREKERMIRVQIIRGADEHHAAFGFIDVTEQYMEQQKRLLGAVPISPDILAKENIGMWAFELDEGYPPRMYGDEAMLRLVGLEHQVPPEEMYHAWYDHIDAGSYDLVADAVARMSSGEPAEVQYPWHCPDGRTIIVRCGGVRNFEYAKGVRVEGTHQDVTNTLHFDEEERRRAKQLENDLIVSKLRADLLAYIEDNEPDLDNAIHFFGSRILEISGCDQVVYRELDGSRRILNAPGVEDIPESVCAGCPFARFDCEAFGEDDTVLMNDCRLGFRGMMPPADCPARSSFMQMIYSGGSLVGKLTVHYLKEPHSFTENGIGIMKIVATYLGLLIGRVKEKQAEIARIEAESSNKAKTEFLFNMSHDIRTPMNAILGYTDIALNHIDEPGRVSDSLRKIRTSGGHLLNLINDILEMSRIEAGRLEIVNAPVNVYEVSESVINMSQALASTKDIVFSAEIGELKNPYIYADELHANQVFINLISNAIKYTNPGGRVDYRIEQISDPADGIANYRVTVKDNGIGMSEEFQKHLFESFSREQTATVSRQEGAGLGLAIVKRIVDLIGGTIRVKSRQGEGSVFTVELPMKVMDAAAVEAFEASRHSGQELTEDIPLEGKRVLLVEDNEMNREIATELLKETGLIIDSAEDGAIAIRKVMEHGAYHYDFILMDIQMPVMNGYEATAEIRKLPGGDRVPIIALSANAFKEDMDKSIAAGMNAHVAKPIKVKELLSALAKFR